MFLKELLKGEDLESTMKRYDVSPEAEMKRREEEKKENGEDKGMENTIDSFCCGMNIYVDSDQLPEIEKWNVEGEYMMIVKVKQTSLSVEQCAGEKKKTRATLQIQEIMVPNETKTEEKEDEKEEEDSSVEAYVTGK